MNHISTGKPVGNVAGGNRQTRPNGLITPLPRKMTIQELIDLGNKFHKDDQLDKAETVFRKILEISPANPVALHFLGVIAQQLGNQDAAIKLISKAIEITPDYHQAYNNIGNSYEKLGEYDQAAENYAKAVEIKPDYTDALFNLGLVKRLLRKYQEAAEILQQCIDIEPRRTDVHFEMGCTQQRMSDRLKAQISFQIVLNIDPEHIEARINLGNILNTLAQTEASIEAYDYVLERHPDCTKALNAKGVALRKVGRFDEAFEIINYSFQVDPENLETLNTFGSYYQTIGDNEMAADCYGKAVALNPDIESSHKCLLFVALNLPRLSSQELFDIHRQVRGHFDRPEDTKKTFPDRDRDPNRKIRIGYVSSDFRTHVVALNVLPVIASHNKDDYEVYLYAQVEYPDSVTLNFMEITDGFRSTMQKSNEEVAEMIEEDEIDVLIYLAGRFDENRPIVATHRPAPIQISYHDCATSGLEAMDYYMTDDILHPQDTQEMFTEELYRLPVYYQYPVQDGLPEVGTLPALKNGYVTFGTLNKPEKINEQVIELWSKVLKAVPNSKLYLKYFNHYSEPTIQKITKELFAVHDIGEDRLIFVGSMDNRRNHLELYADIDITLDAFPFNGATTTFEAITMGVPVVTLLGRHFVDRVASSIVTHAGFPELVAENHEEYVDLAVKLTNDLEKLNEMRSTLRDKIHASALCQSGPYARNVEAAIRDMWKTWCQTGGYQGK
jgi:protein O-GlcNAc transferase